MIKKEWNKRKKFWREFSVWKDSKKTNKNYQADIHLIGEMVDFYLRKHPEARKKLISRKNYGWGIMQLHKNLSLWRKKYAHYSIRKNYS